MPTLNHINLPVLDVQPLRDFFVQHFAFTPIHEPPSGRMAVLRGSDGFILNIMQRRADDSGFPTDFHVGFLFDTPDEVLAINERLQAAGVRGGLVEHMTRGGVTSDTFYCFPQPGLMVEVSCYR